MYRHIISIIIFSFLSCTSKNKLLPKATGADNEILIVTEDFIWEGEKGKLIKRIMTEEIYGLNQPEPLFKAPQVNRKEFRNILKTHKNIIITQNEGGFKWQKNKWAENQLVFQINLSQSQEILEKECNKMAQIFEQKELKHIRSQISKNQQKEIQEDIKNKFQINTIIPSEYILIKDTINLFWVGLKNTNKKHDEIHQIIIYSFDAKTKDITNEVIVNTDLIFSKNLYFYSEGVKQNEHVEIYKGQQPIYEKRIHRGLWRTTGKSFMGGPFLAKHYVQDKTRIVVVAVIIYAPNKLKRKYVKRIEAMFLD